MERKVKVETFRVDYECDKCHNGNMVPTGNCLMSYPPQHVHVCDNCGYCENFLVSYPAVRYVAVKE